MATFRYATQGGTNTFEAKDSATALASLPKDAIKGSGIQAITPDSLTPVKPAVVPMPPTYTDPAPVIAGGNAVLGANASTLSAGQNGDLASIIKNLYPEQQQSNAGLYASQYKESIAPLQGDVNVAAQNTLAAQQRLAGVNARITGITAKAQQMNLQQEGRHANMAQITGQQAENNRKAAIEALPLQVEALTAQAEVAAAQGQQELAQQILSQAQTHLDTVFSIQMKDAENAFNYKKNLFDTVFTYANEQQKNQLQVAMKEAEFAQQEKMAKINNDFAEQRVRLEASLKQKDPLYQAQLAKAQAEVGGVAKDIPMQQASSKANVDLISGLTTSPYLGGAVGPNPLSRISPTSIFTGGKSNFIAGVEQMRSQLNLDTLIKAKAQGATFGALSDSELQVLASAATRIGTWAKKDKNGNITGYKASEADFRKELDKINNFAKLDYIIKGGDPVDVGAQMQSDGSIWTLNSDGSYTRIK